MQKKVINTLDAHSIETFSKTLASWPDGWINIHDLAVLYTIAKKTSGAIMEVGSWIGRSSCAISYGLRDGEFSAVKPRFDIVDYGITGLDEWRQRFGNDLELRKNADRILKVIYHPGGSGALLKQNLVDRKLSQYVRSIFLGSLEDYSTKYLYDFIFCDAAHSEDEIRANIPLIQKLLNGDDFVLVCDDIVDQNSAELVNEVICADIMWMTNLSYKYSKFLICAKGKYADLF